MSSVIAGTSIYKQPATLQAVPWLVLHHVPPLAYSGSTREEREAAELLFDMGIENLMPKGELQPMRIGYARVSTRDQNLELQLDALNKAECKRIFTDKLSGTQVERPGLKEALSHLREADTLVVWKLDRLGRSVKGLVDLVNELETQKVHFQSITDGVDTKTPAGRFFFHVMASLANGARADPGAHPCRTGGCPVPRTRRGSKASDDRQQGSGGKKAIGKRDAATRGGAQLRRVGPHVISMGTGFFADVKVWDKRWTISKNAIGRRTGIFSALTDHSPFPKMKLVAREMYHITSVLEVEEA